VEEVVIVEWNVMDDETLDAMRELLDGTKDEKVCVEVKEGWLPTATELFKAL
jgi:hypothetical protein